HDPAEVVSDNGGTYPLRAVEESFGSADSASGMVFDGGDACFDPSAPVYPECQAWVLQLFAQFGWILRDDDIDDGLALEEPVCFSAIEAAVCHDGVGAQSAFVHAF